jgi:tetratricopeptide (TPR) repeat protein
LIYMGDSAAAQACLESLLTLARVGGRADIECLAMNRLNAIAQDRGDFVAARAYLVASLAIAHASGNRRIEGGLSGNLGLLETRLGNYAAARELLQAGLDVARAIGDRVSEIYALWGVAAVALEQGDAPTALSIALEGRDIAREVADPNCEAACILVVGAASAELGHAAQAIACFDEYEDWARQKATGKALPPPMAARAELELSEGRLDEALALVTQIAAWLDANPDVVDEDRLKRLFVCHRVLAAAGVPRADEFLARSHATLQSQVQKLPDADRTAYLGNIRLHREIAVAFSSRAS